MPRRRTSAKLPATLASLGTASLQTVALRTAMIACGTCTPAEYQRMVQEKAMAAWQTSLRLASWPPASPVALIKPWQTKAKANAKRLKRRRRR